MTPEFDRAVTEVIASLRAGEVVSYGWVAAEAGFPGHARTVGVFLATAAEGLPWWRVVRADRRIVSPSRAEQVELLRAEGVAVDDYFVRGPVATGADRRSRPTRPRSG
jgi:methylated-DNA-protein-cysteine methyltransferase-like protein